MPRKGAIELSLGFIVAVVFAVVLLSLAIMWIQGMFSGITQLGDDLTQQSQTKLQETFSETNSNFAIWPNRYELAAGRELKMSAAIKNNANDGNTHNFVINVVPATVSDAVCAGGDLASCPEIATSMAKWVSGFKMPPQSTQINSIKTFPISVTVPSNAVKGTYIFSVVACQEPITSYSACTPQTLNWGGSAQDLSITVK